jgi:hypothetical protein
VHTLRVRKQAKHITHSGPPLALAFPRDSYSATQDPEQENNQRTAGRMHVPQADSPTTRLHNSDKKRDREKTSDHMRVKYAKTDIKLKHNFMNMITYTVRHNEHAAPPEPIPWVGR